MIKQPEKGTRNANDLFYEAERNRIDMLNREFFQDVELSKEEKRIMLITVSAVQNTSLGQG